MTDKLDEVIEALTFLLCGDAWDRRMAKTHADPVHLISSSLFDGFEPMFRGDDDDLVLIGDHPGDQPVWPVDVALGFAWAQHDSDDEGDNWTDGAWQFHRYKTLDPKEWRGKLHRVYPRMVDNMVLTVSPDGKRSAARFPLAIVGDKVTVPSHVNNGLSLSSATANMVPDWGWYGRNRTVDEQSLHAVQSLGGFMLRRRYYWSVLIGEGHGPRARFITDIAGMREVFRLRDIPPGRARRAALLHWVREHWRKRRLPGANDRHFVRQHLRGVWSYQWNGLHCQIEPSVEDLEALS